MLPMALSEVLGISLSNMMKKYFNGASDEDDIACRIVEDIDQRVTNEEGELWLANESRCLRAEMELDHQRGDDTF
jgi:hypothetical protein